MKVDLTTIRSQFDALLAGKKSRESVSNWAYELHEADDHNDYADLSEAESRRIWDAISFLLGVDLKDAPDSYLHNEEDIMRERP